jgi:hypothetical protein
MSPKGWIVLFAIVIVAVFAMIPHLEGTYLASALTGKCSADPQPPECCGWGRTRVCSRPVRP